MKKMYVNPQTECIEVEVSTMLQKSNGIYDVNGAGLNRGGNVDRNNSYSESELEDMAGARQRGGGFDYDW